MQRWIHGATIGLASLWLTSSPSAQGRTAKQLTPAPNEPAIGSAAASSSAPGSEDGLATLTRDFALTVTEDGPNQPWTITLANRGNEPLGFIADPGLLWLDVTLPGRAPQSCRLPAPLRPSAMQRKSVLVLNPGEQYSRRLDPRFFCFSELGQGLLVPRAKVTPYFGWSREPVLNRSKPRAGKGAASAASAATKADQPPFVAWRLEGAAASSTTAPPEPSGSEEEAAEPQLGGADASWHTPAEGLKFIQGASLELPDSYASWMGSARRDATHELELVLLAGSDAEDEHNAMVTFGLLNSQARSQQIFVRREVLEYDVQGPDGYFECPASETGPPDFASFSTIAPHGAERAIVRLFEVCPRRSFSRPGLYEVRAKLAAKWSGQELGLDAFVGQLETAQPVYVRVRSGDRSSFARLVVPPAGAPGPAAAPGAALAEPGQEAAPAEEAPDNVNMPDEQQPAAPEQPAAPGPENPPVE
jgi:hypothetical protein